MSKRFSSVTLASVSEAIEEIIHRLECIDVDASPVVDLLRESIDEIELLVEEVEMDENNGEH